MAIIAREARRQLFGLIEKVNDDCAPIEMISKRGNAVLMAADDYAGWRETAYLFRSPANARRLLEAAEAAERGDVLEHELDRA
ncbi:MAG: type II toxin-antitoxin system Phd/YefM family antitoxin [Candidatus Dormibacteraceae bacterium]